MEGLVLLDTRTKFYYHLFIQWLAKEGLLDQWLDMRLETSRDGPGYNTTAYYPDIVEQLTYGEEHGGQIDNHMINISIALRHATRRQDIAQRLVDNFAYRRIRGYPGAITWHMLANRFVSSATGQKALKMATTTIIRRLPS